MQKMFMQSRVLYRLFTLFFLSLTCFFSRVQANDKQANGNSKVSIIGTGIPLKSVFKAIKKQTGLYVMYSSTLTTLDREEKVTLNFKETPLDEVLRFVFKGKDLEWTYNDIVILVNKKKPINEAASSLMEGDSSITRIPAVTGKVTDVDGNPIIGATIMVKGTNQGINTDAQGNFTLLDVKKNALLTISSIGYSAQEISVRGKTIMAQLSVAVSSLDETVIVAYGTTTKRFNTGNVSTVKGADIAKQPVNNPLAALEGRVPGMVITQESGVPGGGFVVRIRGQNSIANGNDPLYIIDGVPYISQLLPSNGYNIVGNGNPLNFISPNNIESIDILKDADATAIYGSRAANGVVLITTKKGNAGKTKVTFNIYQGMGKVTRKLDLLNREQYLQMRREALKNDGVTPDEYNAYDLLVWDTTRSTDWQKLLTGGTSHYTDAQVAVSGGNENTQYTLGGGYHRESTVFPGDFADQKGTAHFSLTNTSANQRFRVQLSGNYMVDQNNLLNHDFTSDLALLPPNAPEVHNADGTLNWANSTWPSLVNPFAYLLMKYKSHTNNLTSNVVLSYQVLPGLEIKSSFGYTNIQLDEITTTPQAANDPAFGAQAMASFTNNNISSWIIEPQMSYFAKLGPGKLNVLLGTTFQHNNSNGKSLNASGFNSDALLENIQAASSISVSSVTADQYRYNAFFGRLNYSIKDKYLLNLTARRDGSSRFGPGKQFANFGAVGAAWIFSSENFIKENLSFLSFGKLRASYGTSGNDQIGDYRYLELYNNYQYPYQGIPSLYPGNLFNPDFAWEINKKSEAGIELGFLKDRILFTASYYDNRSSNQLVGYTLPAITGFSSILMNLPATVRNSGMEVSLNTINIKSSSFTWSSSFNVTISQNKLLEFPDLASSSYNGSYVIGKPITGLKLYHMIGVDPATGVYQFGDSTGKPITIPNPKTDRTVFVNTAPKYYGGIQNVVAYKGFELDFLFQFVKQVGRNNLYNFVPGTLGNNQPVTVLDRWQKEGDQTNIQRFNSDYNLYKSYTYAINSDQAYTDASFIRLKNVSFSYRLPAVILQRAHIDNCRIYLQGQNLLTITNYKGADPENQSTFRLPPLKVLTAGIQVTL